MRRQVLEVAAQARRLFPRGGFEGLEPTALQVLLALGEQDRAGLAQLADQLALDASTVRHAIARLSERKLVISERDPSDRRRVEISATVRGQRLAQRFLDGIDGA